MKPADTAPRIEQVLDTREKTHGLFSEVARVAQAIKMLIESAGIMSRATSAPGAAPRFSMVQKESLNMIASKLGRIAAGDPNEVDHWADIAGYALLAVRDMERSKDLPSDRAE